MKHVISLCVAWLMVATFLTPAPAGEVAIYTGTVNWIDKAAADVQAQICVDRLDAAGITNTWFQNPGDDAALATWMADVTDDGETDVLVLYGWFPPSIYPAGNTMPNGSIAELFIESEDGDTIIHHADWMFYVSTTNNGPGGLQNMMDLPGMQMGPDNTQMVVTDLGRAIAPNLTDFLSDRPLYVDQLAGEWFVEASLAQNAAGTRADPIIVRDGARGRLVPLYMTNAQNDPKGAVTAEVIAWLLDVDLVPTQVGLTGPATTVTGTPARLTLSLVDDAGIPTPTPSALTVNLATSSGDGAFDTVWEGSYDGSLTSLTIPAGTMSVTLYYRDGSAGETTLTATLQGGGSAQLVLNVLEDAPADPGEVVIYTGAVGWIDKGAADAQAQICGNKLQALGIAYTWYDDILDAPSVADWMSLVTDNGEKDVLVLYGHFPDTIYPAGNTSPDGSIAELFIESTDGDTIINHADYMFYVSSTNNDVGGLQNMMDIPTITMWDDNTPVVVTDQGKAIAPSLSNFLSDRPLHINELAGDWFVEASLAQNAAGTRADPVIVRDGNRGRLVPVYQASFQDDPKGAVAAEIIAWLYGIERGGPEQVGLVGTTAAFQGDVVQLTVEIQDGTGSPSPVGVPTTVGLQTSSANGAFDVAADGPFNGSVTSVTVAAGEYRVDLYYKDTAAGTPTLTGSTAGLTNGTVEVTIYARSFAPPGEVAVYTGTVGWIDKGAADVQAQICVDRLDAAGILNVWYKDPADDTALAEWVGEVTDNGKLDVLVLYGNFPTSLYPDANSMPDGSIAELFIESPDGDVILNHGDWIFYVNGVTGNGPGGLQNMMDIPGITMGGADDTPMLVTDLGGEIAPSLGDFLTDRPMFLNQLAGNWLVEAALAESADGALADPVIVRDGDLGRLIPVYQTAVQNDPKGAVAAEIISWLMGTALVPTQIGIKGAATTVAGTQVKFTVSLQDGSGTPMRSPDAVTVELDSSSATGAFDTAWNGSFGSATLSVTIPAGETTAAFYYLDTSAGLATLTASAPALPELADGQLSVNVFADISVAQGEVAIYTGAVGWVDKAVADAQAQICANALEAAGVNVTVYSSTVDDLALADWVDLSTDNGEQDVLVLYGYFPPSIYTEGNGMPDGSLAELFIESTDGDVIINHADYMFFVSTLINDVGGLQNMMDLPLITMWDDDTPMSVTAEGGIIAPSLVNFASDRPFHVDELAGDWFVEVALAEDATGTRADPVIVRDGNRGRLIPVHQANAQDDPKGAVAAEIILWLREKATGGGGEPIFHRGDANADGAMNITDGIFVLNYLFLGGETPSCLESANGNDDADINITDGIFILNYLFLGGPEPPAPGPTDKACGRDPAGSPSDLGCDDYPSENC